MWRLHVGPIVSSYLHNGGEGVTLRLTSGLLLECLITQFLEERDHFVLQWERGREGGKEGGGRCGEG